jgi:hypothetical protein
MTKDGPLTEQNRAFLQEKIKFIECLPEMQSARTLASRVTELTRSGFCNNPFHLGYARGTESVYGVPLLRDKPVLDPHEYESLAIVNGTLVDIRSAGGKQTGVSKQMMNSFVDAIPLSVDTMTAGMSTLLSKSDADIREEIGQAVEDAKTVVGAMERFLAQQDQHFLPIPLRNTVPLLLRNLGQPMVIPDYYLKRIRERDRQLWMKNAGI